MSKWEVMAMRGKEAREKAKEDKKPPIFAPKHVKPFSINTVRTGPLAKDKATLIRESKMLDKYLTQDVRNVLRPSSSAAILKNDDLALKRS